MARTTQAAPSLESLIESEDIGLEVLHPGGLEITEELARMCGIGEGTAVLDIASGTGESACFLVDTLRAQVTGIDAAPLMVDRARRKAAERGLSIVFEQGDAMQLPFPDNSFDAVISECTTCILDKHRAIAEMVRVVRPGGRVGIHDICWLEQTPERIKSKLEELEGEAPETLKGWQARFEEAGLVKVETADRSGLMPLWTKGVTKKLGVGGQLRIFGRVLAKWGLRGLWQVWQSERIFESRHTGYGIIVGSKPTRRDAA